MKLWMSQDGEKSVLAEQFEIPSAMEGVVIYVTRISIEGLASKIFIICLKNSNI